MNDTHTDKMAPTRKKVARRNLKALELELEAQRKMIDSQFTKIAMLERQAAMNQAAIVNLRTQLASIMGQVGAIGPTS